MEIEDIQQRILEVEKLQIIGSGSHVPPHCENTLSMVEYAGVVDYYFEELVLTVKAGTPLNFVEQTLAEKGQAMPFSMIGRGTIGGAYAVGSSQLRDAVLGVKIVDGRGRLLTFGGQVMKNVAGYDVARLLVGSKGQLAVICEISFKVFPVAYINYLQEPVVPATPSNARVRIEQRLKNVFDPNSVFV